MGDDLGPVPAVPDAGSRRRRPCGPSPEVLASIAAEAGLRRIHFVAWRDLDDPEAGGSELHAHRIASRWAAAGLDVTFRTSAVPGAPAALTRDGYRVLRQAGRYAVFPGAAWEGIRMGHRPGDALVEIWNGMPFLSPALVPGAAASSSCTTSTPKCGAWCCRRRWPAWATLAEQRIAPRFYRHEPHRDPVRLLARRDRRPAGLRARPRDGGAARGGRPLLAGRPALADAAGGGRGPAGPGEALRRPAAVAGQVKTDQPALRAVIIGEGYERPALEALRDELGARTGSACPGRVDDAELVAWYRRAWVVASSSQREGWGMTLTEAAACGTPAVATAIAGHADAVLDGESGLLVETWTTSRARSAGCSGTRCCAAGCRRARWPGPRWFTWDATARRALEALAEEATTAP